MASDTAPAAVPGPNENSTAPTSPPAAGGLTGMLTPVEPARPAAFTLDPATTVPEADGTTAVDGASSAAYHQPGQPENTTNGGGNTARQERSVVRAWLLAGAERWKKGADARNKRLDIKKARAQARQVKETVTVNRSEKTGGGFSNSPTGGNSGAGKSLTGKTDKNSSGKSPKNTSGGSLNDSAGGSGGSSGGGRSTSGGGRGTSNEGRGTSGGGQGRSNTGGTGGRSDASAGSKHSPTPKPAKDHRSPGGKTPGNAGGSHTSGKPGTDKSTDTPGRPKPAKDHAGSGTRTHGGGTPGGKTGPQGTPGQPGQDAPSGKTTDAKPAKVDLNKPKKTKTKTSGEGARQAGPDPKTPTAAPDRDGTARKDAQTGDGTGGKARKDREKPKDRAGLKNPKDPSSEKAPNGGKDGKHDRPRTPTPGRTPHPAPRTRIDTQASREAGYRDGTRIGLVVAHTQAYRDGYRDGRTDTAQAAAAEKARLDQARADRKNTPTRPDKDRPVTQPASSADYQPPIPPKPDHAPGPQPVQVTGTDATHIHLAGDAARPHVSRGEVRTLRGFQQRLEAKTDTMTGVAEATRVLEHHAQEQAKQIAQLLEQARGVEGGDKLVTALTRLAEAAQVQVGKAGEVHKRALRAGEACKTLTANTETRYGGIYRAVVDSPETSPAEMRYYREMETASV